MNEDNIPTLCATGKSETPERVLLLACVLPSEQDWDPDDALSELTELVRTAGGQVVDRVVQHRSRPDPATYIGRGKAQEVAALCQDKAIDLVVFDGSLAPGQASNLEEVIDRPVLDRTGLILDVFARRAKTSEGKLQVELAQLQYALPRLVGSHRALSRTGGGIGTRGPGETKLETDRRRIRDRMAVLRRELRDLQSRRATHRAARRQVPVPVAALVGYTNAGKSTLLNALTGSNVLAEDRLFSTLDPTARRLLLPNHQELILTDTVGFVRRLPPMLTAAFKATLEEVVDADLLIHVIDVSHPRWEAQAETTLRVLHEIGAGNTPMVVALNKIDLLPDPTVAPLRHCRGHEFCAAVSALRHIGLEQLLEQVEKALASRRELLTVSVPYDRAEVLAAIRAHGYVTEELYGESSVLVTAEMEKAWAGRIRNALARGDAMVPGPGQGEENGNG